MMQAISRFLTVVAALVEARGTTNPLVADALHLGAILVREGDDARAELEALTGRIEAMVAEGRDPSDDELAAVKARREELVARIRGADVAESPGTASAESAS